MGQGHHRTSTSLHVSGNACAEKGKALEAVPEGGSRWILLRSTAFLHLLRFLPCCSWRGRWMGPADPIPSGGKGWRPWAPSRFQQEDPLQRRGTAEDTPGSQLGPGVLAPCGPGGSLRGFCAVVLGVTPEGPAQSQRSSLPGCRQPPVPI